MPIYTMTTSEIVAVNQKTFADLGLREREDVQRLLRQNIRVISEETLIVSEEFGNWEDSRRRIDLLGLDKSGQLVVIELKRTEDGGHMELQAIRYAAMVSTMKFEQLVETYKTYLRKIGQPHETAEATIQEFLTSEDGPVPFKNTVRIVLASAEFNREITSSVLWLNEQGLDITCVRLRPHRLGEHILLDVQQVIPLPEAKELQVAIREKAAEVLDARNGGRDFTKYTLRAGTEIFTELNKRWFLFHVVREAIRRGVTPDHICNAVPWRKNSMFLSLQGIHSGQAVVAASPGKALERYFYSEGEVFHVGGVSYVLSNQWGHRTEEAASNILALLPLGHGLTYEAQK